MNRRTKYEDPSDRRFREACDRAGISQIQSRTDLDQAGAKRLAQKRPVYLNLTDDQGTLLLRLDLSEYDLSKPIAQMELLGEIRREVKLAQAH